MPGRRRKPTRLHLVHGTYKRTKHGNRPDSPDAKQRAAEPKAPAKPATRKRGQRKPVDPAGSSAKFPAPKWLDPAALEVWNEYAPELRAMQLLDKQDGPTFAAFCVAVAELRWCQQAANRKKRFTRMANGNGERIHTVTKYRLEVAQKVATLGAEFGMSPASRSKVEGVALGGNASGGTGAEASTGTDGKTKTKERKALTDRHGKPI